MIGTTLQDIRDRLADLASETGEYYLVCARYGDRPVPASGLRFDSRRTARVAARMTEQYRAALRRYDPRLPYHEVVVYQDCPPGETARPRERGHSRCRADHPGTWTLSEPAVPRQTASDRRLVEFCHRVAASVFEALSVRGHERVESAVMDAYLEFAERRSTPDGLCLCLLECMAGEIATGLPPTDQAAVLSEAAARLDSDADARWGSELDPADAALSRLRAVGIVENTRHVGPDDPDATAHRIELADYALSRHADRLPLLPVLVELHRYGREWLPVSAAATGPKREWRIELVPAAEAIATGDREASIAPAVT
ncbi:DUF7551 domain-containing protein [Halobellus limi]|uniref:Uncharacterized protein n=1 Tax=Halobellus limi TaxID=699433 RepID=A0A1H6BHV6_9EURY|nr:hypothetical protein [Halobellus limi]QCC49051.1 hypothetical protein DV707_14935 [Halobellus limi]SEG60328.1 hypothetical protein SAMN04488133_2858 [Halobellus limi]